MSNMNEWKIWIDTGGTFTDCLAYDPDGNYHSLKVLSNSSLRGRLLEAIDDYTVKISINWPIDQDIFSGYTFRILKDNFSGQIAKIDFGASTLTLKHKLPDLIESPLDFEISSGEEVPVLAARLVTTTPLDQKLPKLEMRLGTTRGTNALLEGKGAEVTFLVTKGFRDLVEIGNQQRPDIFCLDIQKRRPLYQHVIEIEERINADGEIIKKLTEDEIRKTVSEVLGSGSKAVAIAFLHSYKNPTHEEQLHNALKEAGIRFVSRSSELSPTVKVLPRAETALVNAYLHPIIDNYLRKISEKLGDGKLKVMTSAGGLVDAQLFRPKDSLLSGPAGGLVGAINKGKTSGQTQIITLDMGGTSSDVARFDGDFDYRFEMAIGDAKITTPSLSIETIAAGGGSICGFDGYKLFVGPESAGSDPGPACYGNGGPLTITDINLLLGRISPGRFSIPVNREDAHRRLTALQKEINSISNSNYSETELLYGFLEIANEKMAEAIRKISVSKGYAPKDYALLSFGGAGGQHACKVAELLEMEKVIIPYEAGLLSAFGIGQALIERFAIKQILKPLKEINADLPQIISNAKSQAIQKLTEEGFKAEEVEIRIVNLYLRFEKQDTTIEVPFQGIENIRNDFKEKYEKLYGHWISNRNIELESIKVVASNEQVSQNEVYREAKEYQPEPFEKVTSVVDGKSIQMPSYQWEQLQPGAVITGPALITSFNSTIAVEKGWQFLLEPTQNAIITKTSVLPTVSEKSTRPEMAELELFTNRFKAIAEDMGANLERTSFSVNVKERLDFSCAVLNQEGYLVVNAPHIPVHLGGLGLCVREALKEISMNDGDVIITNHPAFGGSHLPDITLIAPVYSNEGILIGFVANRAHHAEVGGTRPGSMPPDASSLIEEGTIIPPTKILIGGKENWKQIEEIFKDSPYPTRAIEENLADLQGGLASIQLGVTALKELAENYGIETVHHYMDKLRAYASNCLADKLKTLPNKEMEAIEYLDDGSILKVKVKRDIDRFVFDFTGSAQENPGNMNATPAIVNSVVIYILRILVGADIPLNEGLMDKIKLVLPEGLLNPDFLKKSAPAVVGGNTEVSQRLTDTLSKALSLAACSQGTMNNLVFGNNQFGFYETICGGTGAGNGFNGSDAVHQHMTNTRITDAEILELRCPVQLERFTIRENSGGNGKWKGGNGVIRELKFLEPVSISILSQHREEGPYGLEGGEPGKPGTQFVLRHSGEKVMLKGIDGAELNPGDSIVIETPGGGGYGVSNSY
ncbi:hydantoinase B/oxoprolinase family protein [Fulvivirgaceae bacterium BMA10]|uniref:Hydantoinase B/oxoprolinase family protein n=1 Tax=Splendidivirga corallicola TaxID=3051826 RepID=A0ABT8KXV3_9BACT|nr:hydantoinase B/oxoprolinase family protein [Fulvivirgaceae bacterium BMA10]